MAAYSCWLCDRVESRKQDLKYHLTSIHDRLRVLCAWCPGKELYYRRAVDLRSHVKSSHKDIFTAAPLDAFGEPNGFWLAKYPQDYIKVIRPTQRESSEAIFARNAVESWRVSCERATRKFNDWQEGWRAVPLLSPSPRPQLDFGDEQPKMSIHSIQISRDDVSATLYEEGHSMVAWFKTDVSPAIITIAKQRESLVRRLLKAIPFQGEIPVKYECNLVGRQLIIFKTQISAILGIDENLITNIARTTHPKYGGPTPVKKAKVFHPIQKSPVKSKHVDVRSKNLETTPKKLTHQEDSCKTSNLSPSPLVPSLPRKPAISTKHPLDILLPIPQNCTETLLKKSDKSDECPNPEISTANSVSNSSAALTNKSSVSIQIPVSLPQHTTTESLSSPGFHVPVSTPQFVSASTECTLVPALSTATSETTITSKLAAPKRTFKAHHWTSTVNSSGDHPRSTTEEMLYEPAHSTQDQIPTYNPTPKHQLMTIIMPPDLSIRAESLLRFGCMPLLPPGRRNWTTEEEIELPSPSPFRFWPPKKWMSFSGDARLMVWETVATTLSLNDGIKELDRADILDSFNFLALPGSRNPPMKTNLQSARYYNYKCVRDVYTGKATQIEQSQIFINLLDITKPNSTVLPSVNAILQEIEKKGINLRI